MHGFFCISKLTSAWGEWGDFPKFLVPYNKIKLRSSFFKFLSHEAKVSRWNKSQIKKHFGTPITRYNFPRIKCSGRLVSSVMLRLGRLGSSAILRNMLCANNVHFYISKNLCLAVSAHTVLYSIKRSEMQGTINQLQ